jgi:hypothetical protein
MWLHFLRQILGTDWVPTDSGSKCVASCASALKTTNIFIGIGLSAFLICLAEYLKACFPFLHRPCNLRYCCFFGIGSGWQMLLVASSIKPERYETLLFRTCLWNSFSSSPECFLFDFHLSRHDFTDSSRWFPTFRFPAAVHRFVGAYSTTSDRLRTFNTGAWMWLARCGRSFPLKRW